MKKLLRNVIRCNDREMQKRHLGKVYAWFMRKLESSGMVAQHEKDEEEKLLNPARIEEIERQREAKRHDERLKLIDEEAIAAQERHRFTEYVITEQITNQERTVHAEIPPAKFRVEHMKRKNLNDEYLEKVRDLKRPQTSVP